MGLEVTSTISGLNASNPTGGDQKATLDDHLRLIKTVLLADCVNNSTKAASGHIKFADGTIINYGTANTNGSGVATLTFSLAFPTAQRFGVVSQGSGNYTSSLAFSTTAMTANMFVANTGAAAGVIPVYYLAIGY
jgi:hypothetical protein